MSLRGMQVAEVRREHEARQDELIENSMTPESMWKMDLRRGLFLVNPHYWGMARFQGRQVLDVMSGSAAALVTELDQPDSSTIEQEGDML